MFKSLISLLVVALFLIGQANATTVQGLKEAFDEFNYSMNVEWDQKDQIARDVYTKRFYQNLEDLRAQGLTNEEFLSFISSELKDQKIAQDLETLTTFISINQMSAEEANQLFTEHFKKTYSRGASWSDDGLPLWYKITVGVFAGLFILAIIKGAPMEVSVEYTTGCSPMPVCT